MVRHLILPALLALVAVRADGQSPVDHAARLRADGVLVARSAGEYPNPQVVAYVAENAEPIAVAPPGDRAIESATARQVIVRVCGSVQPGYEAALARKNKGRVIPLDAPLGVGAGRIVWPACLFASRRPYRTVSAVEGDTQTDMAERFTGFGRFSFGRLKGLFGAVTNSVPVNKAVRIEVVTAPTFVKPKIGTDAFMRGLAPLGSLTVDEPAPGGSIIGPSTKSCVSGTSVSSGPATRASIRAAYPFHADAVAAAFAWTRGTGTASPARVLMVDNGFWGVPSCSGDDCPRRDAAGALAFDEPFPRALFATDDFGGDIGPMLADEIAPNNYLNGLGASTVNAVSGHGTHVAGLIAGGPLLYPGHRSLFGLPGSSWLKLAVANLAPGGLTFARDADQRLFLMLSEVGHVAKPQVVNLSLALTESRAKFLSRTIPSLDWAGTLFVGAAGNEGKPVEAVGDFPARLGGAMGVNMVTVASVDADGALSGFSNHSDTLVDLAAPGCRIESWLTLESAPEPVSGTSQAAPFVTFAAAAIKALWPAAKPAEVKARLAYSGALFESEADRAKVRSGVRLDLFQALLLRDDVVVTRNPDRILLGRLRKIEGLRCNSSTTAGWKQIKAYKSAGTGRLYMAPEPIMRTCEATLDHSLGAVDNRVFVDTRAVFENGAFQPRTGTVDVPTTDLVEFVLAELPY